MWAGKREGQREKERRSKGIKIERYRKRKERRSSGQEKEKDREKKYGEVREEK